MNSPWGQMRPEEQPKEQRIATVPEAGYPTLENLYSKPKQPDPVQTQPPFSPWRRPEDSPYFGF